MKIRIASPFQSQYAKLPMLTQVQVNEKIRQLARHFQSLHDESHNIPNTGNFGEAKVDDGARFTFSIEGDVLIFRQLRMLEHGKSAK